MEIPSPLHGKKPEWWKASGQRILRGLYKTSNGSKINADLNGAANILRKVARNLGIDLGRLGRRSLATVGRIRIWLTPKPKSCPQESSAATAEESQRNPTPLRDAGGISD